MPGIHCNIKNQHGIKMKKTITVHLTFFVILSVLLLTSGCHTKSTHTTQKNCSMSQIFRSQNMPDSSDIAFPEELPAMGKWMYRSDGQRADWLGVKWQGKSLIEPINIILIDRFSPTAVEAKQRLRGQLLKAGYSVRRGHSGGYKGYLDGDFYSQIPEEKNRAFSNRPAFMNNNHGRVFGPCEWDGAFYFTAALSREVVAPLARIKHHYGSFLQARDMFAQSLDRKSGYKIVRTVALDNRITGDPDRTTGDHDGMAVILEMKK